MLHKSLQHMHAYAFFFFWYLPNLESSIGPILGISGVKDKPLIYSADLGQCIRTRPFSTWRFREQRIFRNFIATKFRKVVSVNDSQTMCSNHRQFLRSMTKIVSRNFVGLRFRSTGAIHVVWLCLTARFQEGVLLLSQLIGHWSTFEERGHGNAGGGHSWGADGCAFTRELVTVRVFGLMV